MNNLHAVMTATLRAEDPVTAADSVATAIADAAGLAELTLSGYDTFLAALIKHLQQELGGGAA